MKGKQKTLAETSCNKHFTLLLPSITILSPMTEWEDTDSSEVDKVQHAEYIFVAGTSMSEGIGKAQRRPDRVICIDRSSVNGSSAL
jgi:hypothetical protein